MKNILEIKPEDIKQLNSTDLEKLADDVRKFLVKSVSETGGHLASNLGVVELTIALFKVFDFEKDKIVWDVGHQAYVYKILTGRGKDFSSLRQLGGLSGFPKTNESSYDFFDTGHSSNSISIVAGMITGRDLKDEEYNVIGVIGDGSLTGGIAYEGLNNLGILKKHGIIILNDNGMSIGTNTGSINNHLTKLRTSKKYIHFKHNMRDGLIKIPKIGKKIYKGLDRMKDTIKAGLVKGIIFEEMGFTYLGPIDGHDMEKLIKTMELAKNSEEPVLIHVLTQKGKGYEFSEKNPDQFHGTAPFNIETGKLKKKNNGISYSDVFGSKLLKIAKKNKNVVAISAAMVEGTGLKKFEETFPDRIFDVGIAEQHALSFAAGIANEGGLPFVAIYSSFLQRGYDQLIIDIALQNLPVVICIDRAGCVGADGETHHGIYDLSYLNHIPNFTIFTPATKEDLEEALEETILMKGPVAIRYPRGNAFLEEEYVADKKKEKIVILAVGTMLKKAIDAKKMLLEEGVKVYIKKIKQIKPLNNKEIIDAIKDANLVVTVEDNCITGGFGQQVGEIVRNDNLKCKVIHAGWGDEFVSHGTQEQLMEIYKLDGEGIKDRIIEELKKSV